MEAILPGIVINLGDENVNYLFIIKIIYKKIIEIFNV